MFSTVDRTTGLISKETKGFEQNYGLNGSEKTYTEHFTHQQLSEHSQVHMEHSPGPQNRSSQMLRDWNHTEYRLQPQQNEIRMQWQKQNWKVHRCVGLK